MNRADTAVHTDFQIDECSLVFLWAAVCARWQNWTNCKQQKISKSNLNRTRSAKVNNHMDVEHKPSNLSMMIAPSVRLCRWGVMDHGFDRANACGERGSPLDVHCTHENICKHHVYFEQMQCVTVSASIHTFRFPTCVQSWSAWGNQWFGYNSRRVCLESSATPRRLCHRIIAWIELRYDVWSMRIRRPTRASLNVTHNFVSAPLSPLYRHM